jgi:replicative DNA helicase
MSFPDSLPFSEDMEKGLLCSAMNSRIALSHCSAYLTPEMFYLPAHRQVFSALRALHSQNYPIDFLTLKNFLTTAECLEEIGGTQYLNELFAFVPSDAGWKFYYDRFLSYYVRRTGIVEFNDLIEKLYDVGPYNSAEEDPRALMVETLEWVLALADQRREPISKPFPELVDQTIEGIQKRARSETVTGIRFDLEKLDQEIDGVHPSELCVISGKTSSGKSALALQALLFTARQGRSVALFSLEMPGTQTVERMFAADGEISMKMIRDASVFTESQWVKLHQSAQRLKGHPIHIEENSLYSIDTILDRCRFLKAKYDIVLVVVDYLQLVQSARLRREETREREVADVSRKLKALAVELKVSVMALSQLNDQGYLRESRAIGQDADIVLRIEESESEDSSDVDIVITKHRSSARGKHIRVQFYGQYMKFQ